MKDYVRISPIGSFAIALNTLLTAAEYASDPDSFRQQYLLSSLLLLSAGVGLVSTQLILRKRLERLFEHGEHLDRIFLLTLRPWCDRQTTMVVAGKYGLTDELEKFYTKNRDKMSLPNLPTF